MVQFESNIMNGAPPRLYDIVPKAPILGKF